MYIHALINFLLSCCRCYTGVGVHFLGCFSSCGSSRNKED